MISFAKTGREHDVEMIDGSFHWFHWAGVVDGEGHKSVGAGLSPSLSSRSEHGQPSRLPQQSLLGRNQGSTNLQYLLNAYL